MAYLIAAILLATTVQGPADVEALTLSSDAVLHGRVAGIRSRPASGGGLIFTEVSVLPIDWWKGPQSFAPIAVRLEGGTIGDIGQTVAGTPTLTPGDEVVLFLHRLATGLYNVERFGMGKFSLKPGTDGRLHATRDRRGLSCAGCTANDDDLAFDELRERVRRTAGPTAR
jgi:hypothetical protein